MATKSRKDNRGYKLKDGETLRKDGRYVFRYTDKKTGKRKSVYAHSLQELRQKEKEIILNNDKNLRMDKTAKNLTINDLFPEYLNTLTVSDSTLVTYNATFRNLIKNAIGEYKVTQITPSDIKKFYAELGNKGYARTSIKRANNIINPILEMCVDDGIISKNPCRNIYRNSRYGKEIKEKQALTVEQQKDLLLFTKENPVFNIYYPMLVIMFGTGVRCGELIGLTWNDVDMDAKTVSVNHQLVYKKFDGKKNELRVRPPKTFSGTRIIPMSDSVYNAFIMQKELNALLGRNGSKEIGGYSDFIFLSQENNPMLPSSVDRKLSKIVKAYNAGRSDGTEEMPKVSAHTTRHTFCTRMVESNMNLKILQRIMGHHDVSITLQVYTHIANEKDISEEMKNCDFFSMDKA